MISIRVDTSALDRRMAKLLRIPMATVNRQIGEVGLALIHSTFINQRSFNGQFWKGLSSTTIHLRRRRGSSSTLKLIDSGQLFSANKFTSSAKSVEWLNTAPWAASQNFGNPENRIFGKFLAPIPARPFMPTSETIPKTWLEKLAKPLDDAMELASK